MSSGRSTKTHVIAWLVAVFVGVPVLYLLSVPPVWLTNGANLFAPRKYYYSKAMVDYGDIYLRISHDYEPMNVLLMSYWDWWAGIINRLPPSP